MNKASTDPRIEQQVTAPESNEMGISPYHMTITPAKVLRVQSSAVETHQHQA